MSTNIDKKAFCVTEVNTPVDLDKSTISRYATQVVFGSKLKEMLDSGNAKTNEKTNEKTKVETKEPVVETKEPVAETKEHVEIPAENNVKTTQEEITVDEEGV